MRRSLFNEILPKGIDHHRDEGVLLRLSNKLHFYIITLLLIQNIIIAIYRYFYFTLIIAGVNLIECLIYAICLVLIHRKKYTASIITAAYCIPILLSLVVFFIGTIEVSRMFTSSFWFFLGYMMIYLSIMRGYYARLFYVAFCFTIFFIPGIWSSYEFPNYWIKVVQILTVLIIPCIISSFMEQQAEKIIGLNNELKSKLEEKEKLSEELSEKNNKLIMMSNMMSHDLKSPVRNIKSFSQLIRKQVQFEKAEEKEYFEYIERSAESMDCLINDLLTYSKMETVQSDFQEVNLGNLVEIIKSNFQYEISQKKVIFNISELPHISGDKNLLKTLFHNLISNAVKYQPKNKSGHIPTIDVTVESDVDNFYILVVDNGIGMGEANMEKVFQPFHRFHSKADYEGTGLGMSICKKVMEKHNGEIEVSSVLGEGTSFLLTFNKDIEYKKLGTKDLVLMY